MTPWSFEPESRFYWRGGGRGGQFLRRLTVSRSFAREFYFSNCRHGSWKAAKNGLLFQIDWQKNHQLFTRKRGREEPEKWNAGKIYRICNLQSFLFVLRVLNPCFSVPSCHFIDSRPIPLLLLLLLLTRGLCFVNFLISLVHESEKKRPPVYFQ